MRIETPQQLRDHIELAISVELSTIPPYLFAIYSLEDQASEAALLLKSIVVEEMLHTSLATNVLLAIGGSPRFTDPDMFPTYPGLLPHHDPPLPLSLEPCSRRLIEDVFMRVEQPELHEPTRGEGFATLGQFYHSLEMGIRDVAISHDLFADPQRARQLADPAFYAPVAYDAEDSGGLVLVEDAETARQALEVIVHQGEGLSTSRWADPSHQELTHYHKLLQIVDGTSPLGAVLPIRANPRTADYPEPARTASHLFNAGYRYVFFLLEELFSPCDDKGDAVHRLYRVMGDVLGRLARYLVAQPLDDGTVAAPTFELFALNSGSPEGELLTLAAELRARDGGSAHVFDSVERLFRPR
jgi:hypothetical protein